MVGLGLRGCNVYPKQGVSCIIIISTQQHSERMVHFCYRMEGD